MSESVYKGTDCYNEVDIGETHSGGGTFKIWVKNARVYNRQMSASEIAQL